MTSRTGQALRSGAGATLKGCGLALWACHAIGRLLIAIALLGALGLGALSWRLDQGPIWLPMLARGLEEAGTDSLGGMKLHIERAGIAWAGWREGHLSPVEFRVIGAQIRDEQEHIRAELPNGSLALSLPWLLRGKIAPRRIALASPRLTLVRQLDGSISLDFGLGTPEVSPEPTPGTAEPPPVAVTGTSPDPGIGEALYKALAGKPDRRDPLSALDEISLIDGEVTLVDRQHGGLRRLQGVDVTVRRRTGRAGGGADSPLGGIAAEGQARLLVGQERVALRLSGESEPATADKPAGFQARAQVTQLRPALLAQLHPELKMLEGVSTPLTIDASMSAGMDGTLRQGRVEVTAAPGRITVSPTAAMMVEGAHIVLTATPDTITLAPSTIRLSPAAAQPTAGDLPASALGAGAAPPPVLQFQGALHKQGEKWVGQADLGLDRIAMAELPAFWPQGLAHNTRDWLLENVTAGTAYEGRWRLGAEAAGDFSSAKVTALEGNIAVRDGTVHWLRPVPPLVGVSGKVNFGMTEVVIRGTGTQSGTTVQAKDATIRFYALDTDSEQASIEGHFTGPVADVLTVLKHPRLKLFDKRPLDLKNPSGTADATLTLGFPLLADLPTERITVAAQAKIANMRITDAVLGQNIERGQFALTVDTKGLKATGNAVVGGVPGKLGVEMDFRDGPAAQITTRESAQLTGDARDLRRFGFDLGDIATGPIGIDVRTERRRNGRGDVFLKADLRDTALALDALAWRKPPGSAASAEAVLRIQGDKVLSADQLRLQGPRLALAGQVFFGDNNRFERAEVSEGMLDASRFAGTAQPPSAPGAPWRFDLHGPVADLTALLAIETPPAKPGVPEPDSTPIAVQARFDRVILGPDRSLTNITGNAQTDARGVLREARIIGRAAGPNSGFDLAVTPRAGGRDLRLAAQDGGALLRSFDVLSSVVGGKLMATGRWNSNAPDAPLQGNAELETFSVRDAPGIGKFLQAITVYGLFEAARGPGLSFNRAVIPFTLTPDALQLKDARAFSASLGLTVKGSVGRHGGRLDLTGTVVPAYAFNTLLGNIPLVGRLFSPEQGGGLIAVNWSIRGPAEDPSVSVNPLSALTPGFLRGLFGIFDGPANPSGTPATPPAPSPRAD